MTSRAIEKSRIHTIINFHHISKISRVQCFRNSLQIYCRIVTLWLTDYTINLPSPESWIKASKRNLTILVFVLFTWWQVRVFANICFHLLFQKFRFQFLGKNSSCEPLWRNPELTKKRQFWIVWSLWLPLQTSTLWFSCIFKRFFSKLRQTQSSCQAFCFCNSVSTRLGVNI